MLATALPKRLDVVAHRLAHQRDLVIVDGHAHHDRGERGVEAPGVDHGVEARTAPIFLVNDVPVASDDERLRAVLVRVLGRHLQRLRIEMLFSRHDPR